MLTSGSGLRAALALAFSILIAGCTEQSTMLPANSSANLKTAYGHSYQSAGFSLSLTPNYASGFGPVASLYPQASEAPVPGPGASLGGGTIDFGTVSPGLDYYYRYALEVGITAPSAYQLMAAISGALAPAIPADMLTWLESNQAHYGPTETQYGGTPFGSEAAPLLVASGPAGTSMLKYDFILSMPNIRATGPASAQVEYTVIP